MLNKRWGRTIALSAVTAIMLNACGGGSSGGSSTPAPTLTSVTAGDGQVTLSWTPTSGIVYWAWWSLASSALSISSAGNARSNVISDFVVSGLNDTVAYSFGLNSHVGSTDAAGGPLSNVLNATPRLAPAAWWSGSGMSGGDIYGVAFGNNNTTQTKTGELVHPYLAVGAAGAIFTSPDAKTWSAWTPTNVPAGSVTNCNSANNNLRSASYGNSTFVAVGDAGTICYSGPANGVATANQLVSSIDSTSTNATFNTWQPNLAYWLSATSNPVSSSTTLYAVSNSQPTWASSGSFVAVGSGGTIVYSGDGSTWTVPTSNGTTTTNDLYGVGYNYCSIPNSQWVAVGANNTIYVTTNAAGSTAWTTAGVTINNLPAGTSIRSVACSTNTAVSATPGTLPSTTTPLWVAVADNGYVLTSTDGLTWNAKQSLGTGNMRSVWYGTQFVAVGDGGAVYTSQDGATWIANTASGMSGNIYTVIAPQGSKQFWDNGANAPTKIPNGTKGAIRFGYTLVGAGGASAFGY